MNLSKHFTLEEMLASHMAVAMKLTEQWTPPDEVVDNLRSLCNNLLEPLRTIAGMPIPISSGYRCPALNEAIKASSTSQHLKGEAADINLGNRSANKILYETIKKSNLVWDQMIWEYGDEFGPDWVHISYRAKGKNKKQTIRIR